MFTDILVKNDGSEKPHSDEHISPAEIFALLDTIPVRRVETRQREATHSNPL